MLKYDTSGQKKTHVYMPGAIVI